MGDGVGNQNQQQRLVWKSCGGPGLGPRGSSPSGRSGRAPTSKRPDACCFGLVVLSADSPASKPSSVTNYKYDSGQIS